MSCECPEEEEELSHSESEWEDIEFCLRNGIHAPSPPLLTCLRWARSRPEEEEESCECPLSFDVQFMYSIRVWLRPPRSWNCLSPQEKQLQTKLENMFREFKQHGQINIESDDQDDQPLARSVRPRLLDRDGQGEQEVERLRQRARQLEQHSSRSSSKGSKYSCHG